MSRAGTPVVNSSVTADIWLMGRDKPHALGGSEKTVYFKLVLAQQSHLQRLSTRLRFCCSYIHTSYWAGQNFHANDVFLKGSQSRMRTRNVPSVLNQVRTLNSLLWAPSLVVGWCNKQAGLQKQKCQTEHYVEDLLNFPCHSYFGEVVRIARNWDTVHSFDIYSWPWDYHDACGVPLSMLMCIH